jgi:sialidase-1
MDFQVLATRGNGGYRQYRIPAMAVTPSGRVIAIYDARVDLDDLPGPVDLVIRTSDDNGETWSPQKIFLESHEVSGYGDASIIIDPTVGEKGRIIVFCQASHLASFFESSLGSDLNDPTIVHISRSISDDDGETWSHEIITEQVKDGKTHGIFASSGMGGRIPAGPHAGRLIHSFVLRRGAELLGALAYSDDHGITWKLGAEIPKGNESGVACLLDGSILFHSRSTPYRLSGTSHDGGLTLSSLQPHQQLPDPSDNGSLCVLNTGAVIATHNHDHDLRRRTVAKLSEDGGSTWDKAIVLEKESSAYSTACQLADGRVGVLFERYGYTEMVFSRFDLTELKPNTEVLPIEFEDNQIEFQVAFRYVRPGRNQEKLEKLSGSIKRHIPKVDMSVFRSSERKEIGPNSGSASGDPIFTKEEFDEILGPVSPGLHLGDELRFSGRLQNHSSFALTNLLIAHECEEGLIEEAELAPGEKMKFMDLRYRVTERDLEKGHVSLVFRWSGEHASSDAVSGEIIHRISTKTGLAIR